MEYFKLRKPDSYIVSCLKEIPEEPKGIVIAIHGFSSCKECATYQMLLRRMPAAGYGVIGIDLPGHGSEESLLEVLRIEGALNSIEAAEKYAVERYPRMKICYFASSFGAYLTGLYISTRPHEGRKAFFRSAAVNMPSLFVKENPTQADREVLAEMEKNGYYDSVIDLGKPVRIVREMYHDLETTDLFELFAPEHYGKNRVMMVHGSDDAVIDPKAAREFADRFHIPMMIFDGEGHSLSDHPDTPDLVADLAISFYNME